VFYYKTPSWTDSQIQELRDEAISELDIEEGSFEYKMVNCFIDELIKKYSYEQIKKLMDKKDDEKIMEIFEKYLHPV